MTYCRATQCPPSKKTVPYPSLNQCGFTLVELVVVVAILGVLMFLAFPTYNDLKNKARVARAGTEIREIEKVINAYAIDKGSYPPNLTVPELKMIRNLADPWETPYVYTNIANAGSLPGQARLDFSGPINTDFDLFSKGADRDSQPSIDSTVTESQDDIVRAGDGGYVGLVSEY